MSSAARDIGTSRSSSSSVQSPLLWMLLVGCRSENNDIFQPPVPITCPVISPLLSLHKYAILGALFSAERASFGSGEVVISAGPIATPVSCLCDSRRRNVFSGKVAIILVDAIGYTALTVIPSVASSLDSDLVKPTKPSLADA